MPSALLTVVQVDRLNRQLGHPGVMPRDFQQVVEQRLESVQLKQPSTRSPQRGVEVGAVVISPATIRTVVSGVRSSWLTSEVNWL